MLNRDAERFVVFPMRRLRVLAASCYVAVAASAGCTNSLRASSPGDGAMATGGQAGSGGAAASGGNSGAGGSSTASLGGSRSGGASGATGGASGGTSGTDACAKLAYDYCVADCLKEHSLVDNPLCSNGAWSCRSGYVLASSCPDRGCGATPDACCDLTTGLVTDNPCAANGYRAACPDGNSETSSRQAYCVPKSLTGVSCGSLDRQPCDGPAMGCSDMSDGIVTCECGRAGADASPLIWYCTVFIGP